MPIESFIADQTPKPLLPNPHSHLLAEIRAARPQQVSITQSQLSRTNTEVVLNTLECAGINTPERILLSAGTAGLATSAAAYRYGSPLLRKTPGLAIGTIGVSKLAFADVPDLYNSETLNDKSKYTLACTADLAMGCGLAKELKLLSDLPKKTQKYAVIALAGGAALRAGIGYFWQDSETSYAKAKDTDTKTIGQERIEQTENPLKEWTAEVPLPSGKTETRGYDVYLPKGYTGKEPLAAMMLLHGVTAGDGKGLMRREAGMDSFADQKQFIAIYPYAKVRNVPYSFGMLKIQDWNSPGAGLLETQPDYDDVRYIDACLKDLKDRRGVNIDQNRISVAGFSSGGAFATHLWGNLSGRFSAVASVHGTSLGTESRPEPGKDKTPFYYFGSSHDYFLPGDQTGRSLMTALIPRATTADPLRQIDIARMANMEIGSPLLKINNGVTVSEYNTGGFPVRHYMSTGNYRSGILGGIFGRGKNGFPAEHAWDGTEGIGGLFAIGDKNPLFSVTKVLAEEFPQYRRN